MLGEQKISDILKDYDKDNLSVSTVTSHSALQIFNGARKENLHTIGIDIEREKSYNAFPLGRPNEYLKIDKYSDMLNEDFQQYLRDKNAVIIPHGSFVEYLGAENFIDLDVPTFGNRKVLEWESNRTKEMKWLESAGLDVPNIIDEPEDIDGPCMIKYHGAKGGKGFCVVKDRDEYYERVNDGEPHIIQEFIMGTRYYIHYFYSPITPKDQGYEMDEGCLQILSMDRRDETNIDEAQRLGSIRELEKSNIHPTFVVTGNIPIVMRESLLPKAFEMGESVIERSKELFGGLNGSFCLETVVDKDLKIRPFEISARIVAGTNPYISGSSYSDLIEPGLSTGQRISQEIKRAAKNDQMDEIIS